ncbi:MAG: transcription factor S, partial [Methanomicrobium sp.]|nr:transcription factor S [Methanomicrobium sp.]
MFCPECKSMLKSYEGKLRCPKCGYEKDISDKTQLL